MSRGAARIATGALGGFIAVISGFGLQFLLRTPTASWPGPRIADSLPLEELPRFDRVPVVVYLGAWIAVALILAAIVRWLHLGRVTAGVVLFIGVGIELLALDTLSLILVRQISQAAAFHQALGLQAIYLPPVFAGIAGALAGRVQKPSKHGPLVMACLVGLAGSILVLSALTPAHRARLDLLHRMVPDVFPPIATALVAAAGLLLLLVARGLARRKRRAWQMAVGLLVSSSLLNLLKGLDYEEALIVGVIALGLIARRQDFDRPGDPGGRGRTIRLLALFVGAIYAYGVTAIWVWHLLDDGRPYSLARALGHTTRAMVHVGWPHGDHFGQWFPLSVFLIALAGAITVLSTWLSPWRFILLQPAAHRARARSLVRRWGTDALSSFTLRADRSYFFDDTEESFLAYRVVGGVAFVSSDPVGNPTELPKLLGSFIRFAHARGWQVSVLGASAAMLPVYEHAGLHALYWGDEAVIEPASFSLEGRQIRKVRQSVHRLERAGYTVEYRWASQVPRRLARRLAEVELTWLNGKPRRGGTMSLDDLFRLRGKEALFVIGRDADGDVKGFLHFAHCRASAALSLSSMPRLRDTPNGFNAWLIVEAVAWARANSISLVSLNFSPFARMLATDVELSGVKRLTREALMALKSGLQLQLDNLYRFNAQFLPRWVPRYVIYERRAHLPRIGIAALASEGYLQRSAV